MPGHVAKSEGPDPCPDQWLYVSDELKVIIPSIEIFIHSRDNLIFLAISHTKNG